MFIVAMLPLVVQDVQWMRYRTIAVRIKNQKYRYNNTVYYYEIAPTKIIRANSASFTYSCQNEIAIGAFVMIPVGKTTLLGVVLERVEKPPYTTKLVQSIMDIPPLPLPLLKTAQWMSVYYHTHLATVFQTILPRGIAKKRREAHRSESVMSRKRTHFLLNNDQFSALKQLSSASPGTVLLHGVTGSGKTAVYIAYTKQLIEQGKSVIILVPEIALTSQLVAEFTNHFHHVILTHSQQTEAERHKTWLDVATSTTPRVAIGPRSALFLPFTHLGGIIIDEAHEPSFKQDQSPRYSALRVAGILAKSHHALAIQGSATPLVTEYYLAKHYKRPIIELPNRAQKKAKPPVITVVNMTKKNEFTHHRLFSNSLLAALEATLEQKKQSLIFHNRRGSASITLCQNCGWSAICPRCFVPYTLHADMHRLRCHICGTIERVPTSCPICHETEIIHKGIGTKLIESELKKLFPKAAIARFDGDSTGDATLNNQYQSLYDGSIDIIIGTQVVAKGLDLPHLATVGVVQADAGLSLPDYTASERTFQLLAQVVGRVGRSSHDTSVIVQSYQPDNPAIQFGVAQDYADFYSVALSDRKKGHFPPYSYLLKLTCVYKTEAATIKNTQQFAATLKKEFSNVIIYGPTPSFYERQRDTYRWQIIVKSARRSDLIAIIGKIPSAHWHYDIDPISLL